MFNLESLCLNVIIENFEQFYYAFVKSRHRCLQRNLEFLRRRYTNYLAEWLLDTNGNSIDKYFDFLINEHLECINFDWFKRSHYLDYIDKIFCRLSNLAEIYFSFHGDQILKSVAKFCPNLVLIEASNSDVTDKGVKYLCKIENEKVPCPKLKNISLKNTVVTNNGVECLVRYLPFVERIEFHNLPLVLYNIHKASLSESQDVHSYNLIHLNLKGCVNLPYFTDVLKACLTVCPRTESITCFITDEEQLDSFNCSCLKALSLSCIDMNSSIRLDNFIKVNGCILTDLSISDCSVSISVLAKHCPALKVLKVKEVVFTHDGGDNQQSVFPFLVKFLFCGTTLKNAIHFFSSSTPHLIDTLFKWGKSSSEPQEQFLTWCKNSTIRKMEFMYTHMEINFLKNILLNCHSLHSLSLHNCSYDVHDTEEMKNFAESLPNKPKICYY